MKLKRPKRNRVQPTNKAPTVRGYIYLLLNPATLEQMMGMPLNPAIPASPLSGSSLPGKRPCISIRSMNIYPVYVYTGIYLVFLKVQIHPPWPSKLVRDLRVECSWGSIWSLEMALKSGLELVLLLLLSLGVGVEVAVGVGVGDEVGVGFHPYVERSLYGQRRGGLTGLQVNIVRLYY